MTDFEDRGTNVGDERDRDGSSLNGSIRLSLKYLHIEFSNWKRRKAVDIGYSIRDLYTSLCVLTKQLWVPISVLCRMWKVDHRAALDIANMLCGMSLANLSFRKIGDDVAMKPGLTLHDLHLEFCKKQAKFKKLETSWHAALLNGYFESPSDAPRLCALSPSHLIELSPRPWWSEGTLDDGYISSQLARHLAMSNQGSELAALLLDTRWLNIRGKFGGVLGLRMDFEILDKLIHGGERTEEYYPLKCCRESFQMILTAIQLSWGRFFRGRRAFQFQMCGRLCSMKGKDSIADSVMTSFEEHTRNHI